MYSIQSTENSQAQYKEEQASLVCTDSLIAVLHWPLFFLYYWICKKKSKTKKQKGNPIQHCVSGRVSVSGLFLVSRNLAIELKLHPPAGQSGELLRVRTKVSVVSWCYMNHSFFDSSMVSGLSVPMMAVSADSAADSALPLASLVWYVPLWRNM